jgi:hypothetical protein
MFPHPNSSDPRSSRWAAALRQCLDIVVAFATLRDPEPPPARAYEPPPARAYEPRPGRTGEPPRARSRAHSAEPGDRRTPAAHPHRRPLHPPARAGRPGALPAPSQPCLTPLSARRPRRSEARAGRT